MKDWAKEKAREIVERWILSDEFNNGVHLRLAKEIESALIEAQSQSPSAKVREALEFYADPGSWTLTGGNELRSIYRDDIEMADEPNANGAIGTWIAGKRAREALALIGKEGGG